MPPHCTCGAQLPSDARFCHRCGKPQYEPQLDPEEEAGAEPAVMAAAAAEPERPLEINFRNPVAVRTALLTALLGTLLTSLPIPPVWLWPFVSLILAGFLAVYFYRRRTGVHLSIIAGARMGWLTGIFSFAFVTVFFTLLVVAISANQGGFSAFYQEQLKGMVQVQNNADMERFLKELQTPAGLGSVLFTSLAMLFILFTTFPTLGGALGAKLLGRDPS